MTKEMIIKRKSACGVLALLPLLVCLILGIGATVKAADIPGSNLTYTIDDGRLTIEGSGDMPDYTSASKQPWYGSASSITNVTVGDGVTSIGAYAFCNLTSLTGLVMHDNIASIGDYSFAGCEKLSAITMPEAVKSIGDYAFQSCTGLVSVSFNQNLAVIGEYSFYWCTALGDISIPDNVSTIGSGAFSNCSSITTVHLPEKLITIKKATFGGCNSIREIIIPDSVAYIENTAFAACTGFSSVKLGKNLNYIGSGNDNLAACARDSSKDTANNYDFVIKRYKDGSTIGLYSGQLLYAEPITPNGRNYIYMWQSDVVHYGVIAPDTYAYDMCDKGVYAKYGAGYAWNSTIYCDAYYVNEEGRLVKAGRSATVTMTASSGSESKPVSEFTSTLGNLKVAMIQGESGITLQQLLGRAGLMHVTCTNVHVSNVTSGDPSVVEINGSGKSAVLKALQTGKSAKLEFKIYSTNCIFHGTQHSSSSPCTASITIEVLGAATEVTNDSITLTLTGLPEGETKCTIEGGETKIVTRDNPTVTFDNLGELSNNRIYIETPDGAQATIVDGMTPDITTKTTERVIDAPVIETQPVAGLAWTYGSSSVPEAERTLTVQAVVPGAGELSYQWYRALSAEANGDKIDGATLQSITVPDGTDTPAGKYWYYCVVTNTLEELVKRTASGRTEITVDKAVLEIHPAAGQNKIYGDNDPVLDYTVTGFAGDDIKDSEITGELSRASGENAGSYIYKIGTLFSISGNYSLSLAGEEQFEIKKLKWPAPDAPALDSKDVTSITLKVEEGCEYSMDGGTWQKSPTFTGLKAYSEHSFRQRKAAGDSNHETSDASEAAVFFTDKHIHQWSYSVTTTHKHGDTIAALCENTDGGHEGAFDDTLMITAQDKVYDGSAATVSLSRADGSSLSGTAAFAGIDDSAIVYTTKSGASVTDVPVAAGTYVASVSVGDGDNEVTASAEYTISKAFMSVTALDVDTTYSENTDYAIDVNVSSPVSGVTIEYKGPDDAVYGSVNPSFTNVGIYRVDYRVTCPNYEDFEGFATVTIKNAKLPEEEISADGYTGVYDGKEHGISVDTGSITGAVITYSLEQNGSYSTSPVTYKDATDGAVTVYYRVAKTGYNTVSGFETVSISKKEIELEWDGLSFVYDGNEKCPTAVAKGLVGSDICDVTVSGGQKNAGEYEAKAVGLSNENYVMPENDSQDFTIEKAPLEITAKDQTIGVGGYIVSDKSMVSVTSVEGLAFRHRITSINLTPDNTSKVTDSGKITPSEAVIEELPAGGRKSTDVTDNYDITYVDGKLIVSVGITAVVECPVASPITVGQSLSDSELSGGKARVIGDEVEGTFSWLSSEVIPDLEDSDVREFIVMFTPDDTENYTSAVCPVTLTVNPVAKDNTNDGDSKVSDDKVSDIKTPDSKASDTIDDKNGDAASDNNYNKSSKESNTDSSGTKGTSDINNSESKGSNDTQNASGTSDKEQGASADAASVCDTITPEQKRKNELAMNGGLKISQKGAKINIKWGKLPDADGYDVYVAYCGKRFTKKPTKTVDKRYSNISVKKIDGKKINLKKNFKVYIAAYKKSGNNKVILGKTITGHVVGRKNSSYTNAKGIKLSFKKLTLAKGESKLVKAKTVLVDKKKKQLGNAHAKEFRYASSDKSIVSVSADGKITAKSRGKCDVYVYSRNGYAKKINVTVK